MMSVKSFISGFSLLEILISISIIAIIAASGFSIGRGYLHQLRFDTLLSQVREQYVRAHVMALSGVSQGIVVDLLLTSRNESLGAWIFEATKESNGAHRIIKKTWTTFDTEPLQISQSLLSGSPAMNVFLSFEQPFSELSFLQSKSLFQESQEIVEFQGPSSSCQQRSSTCDFSIFFGLPETSFQKGFIFTLQKGVEILDL